MLYIVIYKILFHTKKNSMGALISLGDGCWNQVTAVLNFGIFNGPNF